MVYVTEGKHWAFSKYILPENHHLIFWLVVMYMYMQPTAIQNIIIHIVFL